MLRTEQKHIRIAWYWIAGFTLLRLVYSGTFLLAPDETNYWQWSRHMAWGYHDQSPMIAWMIHLCTLAFGHSEVGVRMPSVLAMGIASVYMVLIAARWIGPGAALGVAILSQSMLEFNIGGLMATADGLQAAAWGATTYHAGRAFEEDRWCQWLAAGLWFGFGLLSKYTMVIMLPCLFLYGLLSTVHRRRLAAIRPYAGLLLGLMLFLPVIAWNAGNHWNSVRHVAFLGGANKSLAIHWDFFGDYIASQAGLLSPLVFLLMLMAWVLALRKHIVGDHWIYPYLFFTSFPMVAGFAVLSLHTRVYGNWPGAGYLTATVLVAGLFTGTVDPTGEKKQILSLGRKLWPWALGTSYAVTFLVLLQVLWPALPIPTEFDRTSTELQGWRQLGEEAGDMLQSMPRPDHTFLFGLRYQTASELAFYAPGQPDTVSINKWKRPNVYDYWRDDTDLLGWDAVGVTDSPESHLKRLNQVFSRVNPPVVLNVYRDSIWFPQRAPVRTFYVYRDFGFKGGLRWQPLDAADIRSAGRKAIPPGAGS